MYVDAAYKKSGKRVPLVNTRTEKKKRRLQYS